MGVTPQNRAGGTGGDIALPGAHCVPWQGAPSMWGDSLVVTVGLGTSCAASLVPTLIFQVDVEGQGMGRWIGETQK